MKIVLAEDEFLQEQLITETIKESFVTAEIITVQSERGFRSRIPEFEREPPSVFLLDVMLTWDYAQSEIEVAPSDVLGKAARAGIRCAELIRSNEKLRSVPVILFTVLDRQDIDADLRRLTPLKVMYVVKESGYQTLVEELRKIFRQPTLPPRS